MSREERRLAGEALIFVAAVRLALWLVPFRLLRRMVARLSSRYERTGRADSVEPAAVARRVASVARRIPRATCLTQALAAMLMLARHGVRATIRIGVAKDSARFAAHAWLDCDGTTIMGGPDREEFVSLPPMSFRA